MDLKFFQLRYHLLGVKLNLDVTPAELVTELKKENWICWNDDVPVGHENPTWNYRYKLNEVSQPLVQEVQSFICKDANKQKAIEGLYSYTNTFQGLWSLTPEEMYNWTCWHCEFMLDKPGYYLEPHNDYRRLVAAGMIYFSGQNDQDISTTFYTDRQLSSPMAMTTNYGDGWLAVNDYCNWHTGHNKSNYDRYSVLLGLTIKKPQEYE